MEQLLPEIDGSSGEGVDFKDCDGGDEAGKDQEDTDDCSQDEMDDWQAIIIIGVLCDGGID